MTFSANYSLFHRLFPAVSFMPVIDQIFTRCKKPLFEPTLEV